MWGGCVGVAIVVIMTDVVSQDLGGHGPLLLGVMFVLAVYVLPQGLGGIGAGRRTRRGEGAGHRPSGRPPGGIESPEPAEKVLT
jgi:branched-chain amino acid transport system permease protein